MSFSGDGLAFRGIVGDDDDYKMTIEQRSSQLELPALLNIGMSYDINVLRHRITGAGTFTSNSFQKEQYRLGCEYAYRDMFMVRTGYTYEKGIKYSPSYASINNKDSYRTTALRGPSAGFTFEIPMGDGKTFGLDYSYLHTDPFQGCHSLGARINL
jgi:long-subunit fatty acid transport protein